jgi:hypothetical protein
MDDDNKEIIDLITARMEKGRKVYGHGVRTDDDTTQWGTQTNSWSEMALEEVLDGMIYMAAQIIRIMKNSKPDS